MRRKIRITPVINGISAEIIELLKSDGVNLASLISGLIINMVEKGELQKYLLNELSSYEISNLENKIQEIISIKKVSKKSEVALLKREQEEIEETSIGEVATKIISAKTPNNSVELSNSFKKDTKK